MWAECWTTLPRILRGPQFPGASGENCMGRTTTTQNSWGPWQLVSCSSQRPLWRILVWAGCGWYMFSRTLSVPRQACDPKLPGTFVVSAEQKNAGLHSLESLAHENAASSSRGLWVRATMVMMDCATQNPSGPAVTRALFSEDSIGQKTEPSVSRTIGLRD